MPQLGRGGRTIIPGMNMVKSSRRETMYPCFCSVILKLVWSRKALPRAMFPLGPAPEFAPQAAAHCPASPTPKELPLWNPGERFIGNVQGLVWGKAFNPEPSVRSGVVGSISTEPGSTVSESATCCRSQARALSATRSSEQWRPRPGWHDIGGIRASGYQGTRVAVRGCLRVAVTCFARKRSRHAV